MIASLSPFLCLDGLVSLIDHMGFLIFNCCKSTSSCCCWSRKLHRGCLSVSMPYGPQLQFKTEGSYNVSLNKPIGAWDLTFSPFMLQDLTMSICCCLFFRDYGSSKRKSGRRAYSFLHINYLFLKWDICKLFYYY